MTVSSATRLAGPFIGDNSFDELPFAFYVFAKEDLVVVQADTLGVESTLVLDSDYTVTLNPDQSASPGGLITLSANLPTGYLAVVTSDIQALQQLQITNLGGFNPVLVEKALDKVTVLVQQMQEEVSRALLAPITSPDATPQELLDSITIAAGVSTAAAATATAAAGTATGAAAVAVAARDATLGVVGELTTQIGDGSGVTDPEAWRTALSVYTKTETDTLLNTPVKQIKYVESTGALSLSISPVASGTVFKVTVCVHLALGGTSTQPLSFALLQNGGTIASGIGGGAVGGGGDQRATITVVKCISPVAGVNTFSISVTEGGFTGHSNTLSVEEVALS